MRNVGACEFSKDVHGSSQTKNKFPEKRNLAISEEHLTDVLKADWIHLAKSRGYEFTCEKFLSCANKQKAMIADGALLDEEFLENVVGGVGGFQKFAATVSLAIVGLSVMAPAVSASAAAATNTAAAPQTQIEWNVANEMKGSNEEKSTENEETESQKEGNTEIRASANLIFDENLSQLDLLEGNNLNKALQGAVSALLNLTAEDNEGGKYDYFKEVLSNAEVVNALVNIEGCMKNEALSEAQKQVKVISPLKTVKTALERANLKDNLLYSFADSMINEYKVILSRQVADEVIEKNRAEIEKKMGSESASFSASASTNAAKVDVYGTDVAIDVGFGVDFKEGSSETSFYTTSTGFNVNVSAGFDVIGLASVDVGTKIEFTRALIYQSLEQFLDTSFSEGKVSTLRLRVPSINEVAKTRDKMQKHEQKAISTLKTSAESMLKLLGIMAQKTDLVLPKVTRTQSATREKAVKDSVYAKATLGADTGVLKVLADAGFKVSGIVKETGRVAVTSVRHSFIELINDDCSASFGVDAAGLKDYLGTNNFNKVKEVTKLLSEGASEAEVVYLVKTIAHDLHDYNHCLSVMANETASKEDKRQSETKKYAKENNWLKGLHSGRLNMLKAGISIATTLKEHSSLSDNEEIKSAFKSLHIELDNLSKMQDFTKSARSSKKSAEFSTRHTGGSAEFGFSASISLNIPGAGEANISITSEDVKSQFDEQATHDITIAVKLPLGSGGILGRETLQKAIPKIQDKLMQSGNEKAADIANALNLVTPKFGRSSNVAGYALSEVGEAVAGVKNYVTINFCFTKLHSNDKENVSALPGQQLMTRSENTWALKYIKSAESKSVKAATGIDEVNLNAEATVSRATSRIGSDSLEFSANKFNVFAQTMQDSNHKKDVSDLWTSFKSGQKSQLKKIFKNMVKDNSNARYELQGFYNEILEESKESKNYESIKSTVDTAFSDFLSACGNFSRDTSEKNFEKASSAFDKVLKLNFEHNYMAGYNKRHAQLKK